jgi:hypothetical protein
VVIFVLMVFSTALLVTALVILVLLITLNRRLSRSSGPESRSRRWSSTAPSARSTSTTWSSR